MPFIDLNLGEDIQEKECAPAAEYDLVVTSAELKEKTYDNDVKGAMIVIIHDIEGSLVPYRSVYHYLSLPNPGDDKDKIYNKQAGIKRYLLAANIPFENDGFSAEDIQGARFSCKLDVEVDEDGKYPPQNRLNLPSIPKG